MSHTNEAAAENIDQELERQEESETANEATKQAAEETSETSNQEPAAQEDGEAAEYRRQAEENYQKLLRVQADFDNFRRRSRLEKEEFAKYASVKVIEQLLPIIDNFDRALAAGKENTDPTAFVKGVEMILRQLAALLESEGVTAIEAVGQPFNPEHHQAVMTVETDEYEEGIVVEELQKGYMMKDKVIRPSMVKVSS